MGERNRNNRSDANRFIRDAIDDIQDAIRDIRRGRFCSAIRNLRNALDSLFDALDDRDCD